MNSRRHRPLSPTRTHLGIPKLLLAATLTACLTGPAWALKDDATKPIDIEANDVEVRESDNTSVYVGKVQVQQGSMRLLADHVTVYHRENRQPKLIIALGSPAEYRQTLDNNEGEVHAFAKRMEYDADKDELTLIGDGVLIQNKDRLTGERIVYDRARGEFRAGGTGRVKISITPESTRNTSTKGDEKTRPAVR